MYNIGGDGDRWWLFWQNISWTVMEKEREGWQSRGGMGDLMVFWECFTVERGREEGHWEWREGTVRLLLGEADVIHNLHVANGNCKIRVVDGICDTHVTIVIGDSYNHIISSNIFSIMLLYYFFNYAKRKSLDRLVIEFFFIFNVII